MGGEGSYKKGKPTRQNTVREMRLLDQISKIEWSPVQVKKSLTRSEEILGRKSVQPRASEEKACALAYQEDRELVGAEEG